MVIIHNDQPTLSDSLARTDLVRQVGEAIASCRPPCVFGIHGDWGSGKTSFLHQVRYYLTGDCPQCSDGIPALEAFGGGWKANKDVSVVWFEAWQYQRETEPILALLHEIREQLSRLRQFGAGVKQATEVLIRSADLTFGTVATKISLTGATRESVREKVQRENFSYALPAHAIRQQLEHALNILLGRSGKKEGKRLLVFIDDLDRCEAESAYSLLEGIKVYLNLSNCVFVLGMNQEVIEDAIAIFQQRKGKNDETTARLRAHEYLEKLCQNIWHLPLSFDEIKFFSSLVPPIDPPIRDKLREVVGKSAFLPPNPRKVKAFVNTLARFLEVAVPNVQTTNEDVFLRDVQLLLLAAMLYHFHSPLYRILERNPEFIVEMCRWTNGDETQNTELNLLTLPEARRKDQAQGAPVPSGGPLLPTFPDPVRGNVFRIQQFIRDIESVAQITPDEIKRFLLT
jgi:hypothetical protein